MYTYVVAVSRVGIRAEDLELFTVDTEHELKSAELLAFIKAEAQAIYPDESILVKFLQISRSAEQRK